MRTSHTGGGKVGDDSVHGMSALLVGPCIVTHTSIEYHCIACTADDQNSRVLRAFLV